MADEYNEEEQQEEEQEEESSEEAPSEEQEEESLEERVKRLEQERDQERSERVKQERIAKRRANQEDTSTKQDYGQKAYLVAQGIKDPEEQEVVFNAMQRTGDELENVVNDEFIQNKIQKLRNDKEAEQATPKSSGRSGSPASDSVEYWVQKGELPPKDQKPQLRRDVLQAMRKQSRRPKKFVE